MNKIELITVIRGLIKEELRDSRLLHSTIKSVIKESVRQEVDRLLTEMENKESTETSLVEMAMEIPAGSKEKLSGLQSKMDTHGHVKKLESEKVTFVKDKKLNSLLNETLMDIRTGKAIIPPSDISNDNAEEWPAMNYNKDARSFTAARSLNIQGEGNKVKSMLPNVDVEGRPMAISADALPDHLKNALTKNYKPLMKKIKEKSGK